MKKLIDLLSQLHTKDGFQFKKTVTVPWIGTELDLTISVYCQNPTKIALTFSGRDGTITFEQNAPTITIPRLGLKTKLTAINFNEQKAKFVLSGFPDIEYQL